MMRVRMWCVYLACDVQHGLTYYRSRVSISIQHYFEHILPDLVSLELYYLITLADSIVDFCGILLHIT